MSSCGPMDLQWGDIKLEAKIANIRRIIVDGQPEDRTKTKHHRVILLNARAIHALSKA